MQTVGIAVDKYYSVKPVGIAVDISKNVKNAPGAPGASVSFIKLY